MIRENHTTLALRLLFDFEPRTDFIPTRLIDASRDGGCDLCMLDLFWVKRSDR